MHCCTRMNLKLVKHDKLQYTTDRAHQRFNEPALQTSSILVQFTPLPQEWSCLT